MMNEGLSAGDILALTRDRDDDNMASLWSNPFIYLVWLAVLGNGNGLFGGRGNLAAQESLTQAELFDGLGRQDILGNQRSILDSICNLNGSMKENFGNVRYDNLNNVYALQTAMNAGFTNIGNNLTENRFAQQECCCKQLDAITQLGAQAYKNTCEITNAIRTEGDLTRALINQNTMQELRDKLAARDRDLLAAEYQLSQQAQTAQIVEAIRPVSKPAYITCSPYVSQNSGTCGGCGFNN